MSGDRFILNRRNLSVDESSYWLNHKKPSEMSTDYFNSTPIPQQDIYLSRKIAYIKSLSKVLNIDENRRLLAFNSGNHDKYNSKLEEHWPVKPRSKPVTKPQFAVLDLPLITDDLKCNVVHWSTNNHIAAGLDKIIYLWHVPSSLIAQNIPRANPITALRMNYSGYLIAFGVKVSADPNLLMWNIKKEEITAYWKMPCEQLFCCITCIDWHIHDKFIAVSCSDGNISILSPTFKIISFKERAHGSQPIFRIKFSPDGNYLASSGGNSKISVWTVPGLQLIHQEYEYFYCRGLSWHPWRSSYLAYGTLGGTIALLNVSSGKLLHQNQEKRSIVYDLSFNKKTGELVTSQAIIDNVQGLNRYHFQINVLSRMNQVVDRFTGHTGRILYLEWNPDDTVLASAGSDETIYLWKFMESNEKRLRRKNISFLNFDFI